MPFPRPPAKACGTWFVRSPTLSTRFPVPATCLLRTRNRPLPKMTKKQRGKIPRLRRSRIREKIAHVLCDRKAVDATLSGGALTITQAHRTAAKQHPRRIALFCSSFASIHTGHPPVARAPDPPFTFAETPFIAASRPPHTLKQHL